MRRNVRFPTGLSLPAGLVIALLPGLALAHHVIGGRMPANLTEGLLSGLGHPIIGLDHFIAIIAVGLLAAMAGRPLLPPLAFVAASVGGAALHVAAIGLPLVELLIGATLLALAVLLWTRHSLWAAPMLALFALAGLLHGYAYGESIVGAEPTPLVAYFAGFAAIQFAIALAAAMTVQVLRRWRPASLDGLQRLAGLATGAAGLASLAIAIA
jgi:urease accessory protein